MNSSCFLHAAVGKTLTRYAVDLDQAAAIGGAAVDGVAIDRAAIGRAALR